MKISCLSLALFCTAALFSQCKSAKYPPDQLPDESLRFGKGGGFTGIETTYILLENGQLFKMEHKEPALEELSACNRKQAKKLFEKAEALGLETLEFMYPGNIYQFLELQDDGKTNRVAWGDSEHPVDEKIKALHTELMQLVSNEK